MERHASAASQNRVGHKSSQSAAGPPDGSEAKRRKRDQYTLMACYPCKARKVKCDGCTPCECCEKRGIVCSYPNRAVSSQHGPKSPSERIQECPLSPPAEEFNQLFAGQDFTSSSNYQTTLPAPISTLDYQPNDSPQTTAGSMSCDSTRSICQGGQGRVVKFAPHRTNFAHAFNLARSSLEAKGVLDPETAKTQSATLWRSRFEMSHSSLDLDQSAEPILEMGYEKATRALSDFITMFYPLYPCVDLSSVQDHLNYLFMNSADETVDQNPLSEQTSITLTNIDILKAVLGISMLVNGYGDTPLALHLPRYLDWSVEKLVIGTVPEIHDIVMAMLMSIYFFYKSQLVRAWRMIGVAARACFELGLHQESTETSIPSTSADPSFLQILFCCIFMFDHRCAFAAGLPYTMHLEDIHEKRLDLGSSAPYLSVMIIYDCVNSEIFRVVSKPTRLDAKEQQLGGFLEYKLLSLQEKFDTLLSQAKSGGPLEIKRDSRLLKNLQISLSARINHARTLLRMSQLQSSGGVKDDPESANIVTKCACETISLCSALIKESAALGSLRMTFDFFICAALATILLVVSQAPEIYGEQCRHSFHEAVDILGASHSRLFTPRKLSFTFDQLRQIGERINMPKDHMFPCQFSVDDDQFWQSLGLQEPFLTDDVQVFDERMFGIFEMNEYL